MYHFVADQHTPELFLSNSALIPSQTTQYLKSFQLEAAKYVYDKLINKQEFFVFNDESGLGKTASIVAVLSAIAVDKKTLIVVQNDEQYIVGWEFHLGVLTELPVCVIQNSDNTTESEHRVYLAKWSILRSIGDLSKLNFDYVIVDHRGHTLNNNFCTSMLIKNFERKVNVVISSVDLTSDVKLLHNVLRLGGRLEPRFRNFKSFEQKFQLPEAKEVFSKKIDLEVYYRQREILGEYIKEYRLRRYRHQFEQYLPLVSSSQYKTNLQLWLASNQNSNSTLSSDSISAISNDQRSTAGTEEIIECLMRIKHERQEAESTAPIRESAEVHDHSEDPIAMSPLVFESTDSEVECDEKTTDGANQTQVNPERKKRGRKPKTSSTKANDTEILVISDSDCELIVPVKRRRRTPQSEPPPRTRQVRKRSINNESIATLRRSKSESESATKKTKIQKVSVVISKIVAPAAAAAAAAATPAVSTKTPPTQSLSFISEDSPQVEKLSGSKKRKTKSQPNTQIGVPRETRSMQRLTRSANSRIRSKYMHSEQMLSMETPKRSRKAKRRQTTTPAKSDATQIIKSGSNGNANTNKKNAKNTKATQSPKGPCTATELKVKTTPTKSVAKTKQPKHDEAVARGKTQLPSSSLAQSELDYLQCGQQMPPQPISDIVEDVADVTRFRIPATPQSQQLLLLPMTASFLSEGDVAIIPDNQLTEIVVLSSSQEELPDEVLKGQSRRTRALKRRRQAEKRQEKVIPSVESAHQPTLSFGALLAKETAQRSQHVRSPDLFSNCSDMTPLAPAQQMSRSNDSIFEGFKIFGSEVKQIQQQHAKTKFTVAMKQKRDRSCLDILEQMFEPRGNKLTTNATNKPATNVLPTYPLEVQERKRAKLPAEVQRRNTFMDDEDIFEITRNDEFGNRLRLNSSGNISPVNATQQTQPQVKTTQHNKITNYLIGNNSGCLSAFTSVEDGTSALDNTLSQRVGTTLRKSPKSLKSTQSTKLTRWFASAAGGDGAGGHQFRQSASAPTTPSGRNRNTNGSETVRPARRNGAGQRKRLDLIK